MSRIDVERYGAVMVTVHDEKWRCVLGYVGDGAGFGCQVFMLQQRPANQPGLWRVWCIMLQVALWLPDVQKVRWSEPVHDRLHPTRFLKLVDRSLQLEEDDIEQAGTKLRNRGYTLLTKVQKEPWGQIVIRLLSPEGSCSYSS